LRSFALLAAFCLVGGIAEFAEAQESAALLPAFKSAASSSADAAASTNDSLPVCNPYRLQSDASLTFKQRACYYRNQLIAPSFVLQAGVMSAFAELRMSNRPGHNDNQDYPRHFANYYARHAAQDAGELVVGYLHHEDMRPHQSTEHGFARRTGAAFMSVLTARDANGGTTMAFAPIAGSLSSGMVSTVLSSRTTSITGGFERSGFVYSTYLIKALVQEFKPEISNYTHRLLHHGKQD
jgi:hypothetical protein